MQKFSSNVLKMDQVEGFFANIPVGPGLLVLVIGLCIIVLRRFEQQSLKGLLQDVENANCKLLRELQKIQLERLVEQGQNESHSDGPAERTMDMETNNLRNGSHHERRSSFTIVSENESGVPVETIVSDALMLTELTNISESASRDCDFFRDPNLDTAMSLLIKGARTPQNAEQVIPTLLEILLAKRRLDAEKAASQALESNCYEELLAVCSVTDNIVGDTPCVSKARERLRAMTIEQDLKHAIQIHDEAKLMRSICEAEDFNRVSHNEQVPLETIENAGMELLRISSKLETILKSVSSSIESDTAERILTEKLSQALSDEMWTWQKVAPAVESPSPSCVEISIDDLQKIDNAAEEEENTTRRIQKSSIERGLHLLGRLQNQQELEEAVELGDVERVRKALADASLRDVASELKLFKPAAYWLNVCNSNARLTLLLGSTGDEPVAKEAICSSLEKCLEDVERVLADDFPFGDEPELLLNMVRMEQQVLQPLIHQSKQLLYKLRMSLWMESCLSNHQDVEAMQAVIRQYKGLCEEHWLSLSDPQYQRFLGLFHRRLAVDVLQEALGGHRSNEKKVQMALAEEKDAFPSMVSIQDAGRPTIRERLINTASAMEFAEHVDPEGFNGDELYDSARNLHLLLLEALLTEEFGLNGPKCLATLVELGMDRVDDLRSLSEGDLRQCGVPRILARKTTPMLVELGRSADEALTAKVNYLYEQLLS